MNYTYSCTTCGKIFERNLPISRRDEPCASPCPCDNPEGKIVRLIEAPQIVSGMATIKTDNGWKDTLKRIKRASGRSNTINV